MLIGIQVTKVSCLCYGNEVMDLDFIGKKARTNVAKFLCAWGRIAATLIMKTI